MAALANRFLLLGFDKKMAGRAQSDRLEKLRKANDQLKREAGIERIKVSEAAKS